MFYFFNFNWFYSGWILYSRAISVREIDSTIRESKNLVYENDKHTDHFLIKFKKAVGELSQ